MKVLITGAAGMLGADLMGDVTAFDSLSAELAALLRDAEFRPITRRDADLAVPGALAHVAGTYEPDIIVHAAAYADVDGCERDPDRALRDNVEATRHVAAFARERGAHLVHVSTDYVFDGTARQPIVPEAPTNPVNVYGQSKLEAENAVRESGARYVIVRTAWLVGVHGKNFVEAIRNRARAGQPLRVVNDQVGSPTFTFDLAPALLELGIKGAVGVLHATNQGSCTRYEEAEEILRLEHLRVPLEPISSAEDPRPARRPAYSVLDNSAVNAILGKPLPSWRESLAKYLRMRP